MTNTNQAPACVDAGPVVGLRCACCGERTKGRQWHNQDAGYGLCGKCGDWIATRRPFGRDPISSDEMASTYGVRGVHWGVPGSEMLSFRVTTDGGEHWVTTLAAGLTLKDAEAYYIGQPFNIGGPDGTDRMVRVVKVEQLT